MTDTSITSKFTIQDLILIIYSPKVLSICQRGCGLVLRLHELTQLLFYHSALYNRKSLQIPLRYLLLGSVIAQPIQLTTRDLSVIGASLRRVSNSMMRLDNALRTVPPFRDASEADYQINTILSFSKGSLSSVSLEQRT